MNLFKGTLLLWFPASRWMAWPIPGRRLIKWLSMCLGLGLMVSGSFGQAPVITSFGQNGLLVCTNLQPGTSASVEWASSVLGPWTNSWAGLEAVPIGSNGIMQVSVPMFYRVRGVGRLPFPAPSNMVWITAGTFTMGSADSEPARYSEEGPQTTVTISRGFRMGKYEVMQGEYLAVMGSNPSYFQTNDCDGNPIPPDLNRPVEQVSWDDATNYCAALTTRERNAGRLPTGYVYRLPTEAEWEYACRAGTTAPFHYGNELRSGMANFYGYYEYPPCGSDTYWCYNPGGIFLRRTTSVGNYAPNAWGLYDMHGNVWEWCQDWWSSSLPGGSVTDPQGPTTGSYRVIRGGSWNLNASYCRSAYRSRRVPTGGDGHVGFRVVLAPGQP